MNPLKMTGLEIMQAFAQGHFPEPGIAKDNADETCRS